MELNHKDNTWKKRQWLQNLEGGKAERRVATCPAEQGKMNPMLAFESVPLKSQRLRKRGST